MTFEQAVTATSSGGATISNSGTLTMTSMTLAGAFSQSGGGGVSASGTLATSGGSVLFTNAVTLTGPLTVDTTNSGGTAAGANIHFASTINGGSALTLNAGTGGTIALDGHPAARRDSARSTLTNSAGVTAGSSISAASLALIRRHGRERLRGHDQHEHGRRRECHRHDDNF